MTPHLGFARKYRPQGLAEIIGQEAVATTLKNSLSAGKPAHAYLFFGPRGVGKTTSARILAKALNCRKGASSEPCGECDSCREIARSASVDVLELDAATNTQVDRIREMIIETVSLAPSRDRYKIFIIDEVHMLSTASFNALLKTLEEPPSHVVFILATTDPGKIPPTILSRCQRFRFRPVPADAMEAHLDRIAKAEKIALEPEALRLLAQAASGGLRDAVSLLEQAHSHAGGKVTAKTVRELLGVLPEALLEGLARAVLARDASALAKLLEQVWEEGFDPAQLIRDLRERMRLAYLHRLGVAAAPSPWKQVAEPHSAETFSFLIQRLNKALESLRSAESPRLSLELALFGMLEAAYDLQDWVRRLEALEAKLAGSGSLSSLPAPSADAVEAGGRASPPPSGDALAAGEIWAAALKKLEEDEPGFANDLRQARLQASEGGPWRLLFQRAFDADRARRREKDIGAILEGLQGAPAKLLFEVEASPAPAATIASGAAGEEKDQPAADPALQKVLQMFPGKVKRK